MFTTSTQKRDWTFSCADELREKRQAANTQFRLRYKNLVESEEERGFLTVDEEEELIRMVSERGIAFGDSFRPPLWPSIRWTAYMYFKRFFLTQSAMEYSAKFVMTACYYLAAKIEEFYVPINEFVANLRSGTAEQNTNRILLLEPDIMRVLKYHLTVHCPFRPFEGHLMEMKRNMLLLNFDIETLRPACSQFLKDALLGDAMLLFPPSQIALAAIKYSLDFNAKSPEVIRDCVEKLLGVEVDRGEGSSSRTGGEGVILLEKLLNRLDEIVETVAKTVANSATPEQTMALQNRTMQWTTLQSVLEERKMSVDPKEESKGFESDDD